MENNRSHKSRSNSTLYNVSMKGLPLSSHTFIWNSPVFLFVMKCLYTTSIYLYVYTSKPGTKSEMSGIMWQVVPGSKNPIFQLPDISKISSRTFYIGRYTCYILVYFMCLVSFCTSFQFFIYFFRSVCISFCLFHIRVKSLFWVFRFRKIWNPVIFQSTSETHIWISIVTFGMFMFRFVWI